MIGNDGVGSGCRAEERKSRFATGGNRRHGLAFSRFRLGQCCPQHCPGVRGAS